MAGRQFVLRAGANVRPLRKLGLDPAAFSGEAMPDLYRRRWGIEVRHRESKQAMGHRKLAGASPTHAWVELGRPVTSQWAPQVLELKVAPMRRGVSGVLPVVREVMSRCRRARTRRARAYGDDCEKRSSRTGHAARVRNKSVTGPGARAFAQARPGPGAHGHTATRAEVLLCRTLTATPTAA